MAAGAGGNGDQPVRALGHRLPGEAVVDDVMKRQTTPAVHSLVEILPRSE
jgi:hypothetical protein